MFEAIYSDRVRWLLDRVSEEDYEALDRCIAHLEHDPYADAQNVITLVIPRTGRVYHNAYPCSGWAIAFHVEDDLFLVIDEIGRQWPPIDPSIGWRPQ